MLLFRHARGTPRGEPASRDCAVANTQFPGEPENRSLLHEDRDSASSDGDAAISRGDIVPCRPENMSSTVAFAPLASPARGEIRENNR